MFFFWADHRFDPPPPPPELIHFPPLLKHLNHAGQAEVRNYVQFCFRGKEGLGSPFSLYLSVVEPILFFSQTLRKFRGVDKNVKNKKGSPLLAMLLNGLALGAVLVCSSGQAAEME